MKILALVLAMIASSHHVNAGCAPQTAQENLEYVDQVFVGRVTRIIWIDHKSVGHEKFRRYVVEFDVSGFWKGEDRSIAILHGFYHKNRGYTNDYFVLGQEYMVSANKYRFGNYFSDEERTIYSRRIQVPKPHEEAFGTGSCLHTSLLSSDEARKEVGSLGPINRPSRRPTFTSASRKP